MRFFQERKQPVGPAHEDAVSPGGAPDPGRPGPSGQGRDLRQRPQRSSHGERRVAGRITQDRVELRKHAHPEVVEPGPFGGRAFADEEVLASELGERVSLGSRGQSGIEELALVGQERDQVRVSRVGLLRRVARDLALTLHRQTVDEHVVHASPLAGLGRQAPVEAGGLEGDDDLRETVGFGHNHGLAEEPVDLLSSTVQPSSSQHRAVVGERGRLPLTGEVDAQHQCIARHLQPTTFALLLLPAKPPGHQWSGGRTGSICGGTRTRVYFGHGRLTSHVLGEPFGTPSPQSPTWGSRPPSRSQNFPMLKSLPAPRR